MKRWPIPFTAIIMFSVTVSMQSGSRGRSCFQQRATCLVSDPPTNPGGIPGSFSYIVPQRTAWLDFTRCWMRSTIKVSQGEGCFLSAKDQPFQARYIEVAE